MTDKELLELAAKAAGMDRFQTIDSGARFFWNPLTDDGDALRLAVRGCKFVTVLAFLK